MQICAKATKLSMLLKTNMSFALAMEFAPMAQLVMVHVHVTLLTEALIAQLLALVALITPVSEEVFVEPMEIAPAQEITNVKKK